MPYARFIGIDVSQKAIDVAVKSSQEIDIPYAKFSNDEKGFEKMLAWVEKVSGNPPRSEYLFCLEHTGIYSLPIDCFLTDNELAYSLQSGLQVKTSMSAFHRGKSDKTDSIMLAEYACLHNSNLPLSVAPSKTLIKLRLMLTYRERLVRNKVVIQNSARQLLLFTESSTSKYVVTDSQLQLESIAKSIKRLDKELIVLIKSDIEINRIYNLVVSVTGVGLQIGAYLILYTKGFTLFKNWRKFSCYCGLAPFEYSSGTSIRRRTRTSKKANRKLKALIGNGASSALLADKEIAEYYERKVKEGKHKMVILNSIKNKIISRVFATVKRGTPFVKLNLYAASKKINLEGR